MRIIKPVDAVQPVGKVTSAPGAAVEVLVGMFEKAEDLMIQQGEALIKKIDPTPNDSDGSDGSDGQHLDVRA